MCPCYGYYECKNYIDVILSYSREIYLVRRCCWTQVSTVWYFLTFDMIYHDLIICQLIDRKLIQINFYCFLQRQFVPWIYHQGPSYRIYPPPRMQSWLMCLLRDSRTLKNVMSSWWRSHPGLYSTSKLYQPWLRQAVLGDEVGDDGMASIQRVEVGQLKVYQYKHQNPKKNRTKKWRQDLRTNYQSLHTQLEGPMILGGHGANTSELQKPGALKPTASTDRKICKRYPQNFGLFSKHQFAVRLWLLVSRRVDSLFCCCS